MPPKYHRILLKLSGEALLPEGAASGICMKSASHIVAEIKPIVDAGVQVGLVIGAGNIYRGATASAAGAIDQVQADTMGMLATVMNSLGLQSAFDSAGMPASVMTSRNLEGVAERFDRRRALNHLSKGRVVVFGGGTGNPFFSTDTAASLRALEIGADVLLKATKVDGIYSADPVKDKNAKRYDTLTYLDVLGKDLKVMDATAISMCMGHNLPIVVFDVFKEGNLEKVVMGANLGTVVNG